MNRSRSILVVLALALTGCPAPAAPEVQVVFDHLPAGLLSVWGTSSHDVWTVGSDPGDGPFVLHFDGTAWERLATGQTGGLWWVHGWPDGTVMMGGDAGMLLRYDDGVFERMTTPVATRTIFGIWGSAPDDVLAVGGVGGVAGFVWHYDGTEWTDVALPAGYGGEAVFKVWGLAANDAWLVGGGGVLMHWDGVALSMEPSPADVTLFTTHAIAGLTVAVGGEGSGVVVERDDTGAWHDVTPMFAPTMIGVWVTGNDGWAVGVDGQWLRRESGVWDFAEGPNLAGRALHSVWVDPDGGVWAAGGQVIIEPLADGVLMHRGPAVPGGTYSE